MAAFVAVAFVLLPLLGLYLHAREKRRERETDRRPASAALARAGLLEMQHLLEPERKAEILREADSKDDLLVHLDDEGGPDRAGRTGRGGPR
jgi:hypothetical protein